MEKNMLFDAHAHYDDEKFDDCRDELLLQMNQFGVGCIVNAGASIESSEKALELSRKYDFVYFTAGIHPENAVEDIKKNRWLERIEELCRDKKCVAVGEIGLDYYWTKDYIAEQKECFMAQMELCKLHKLPVVVHDREAHGDCLEIVKKFPGVTGLFHCFSGSVEMASELFSMGWYISMGGVVTFKNSRKAVEVIESFKTVNSAYLDRLLLETDAPYLAPVPHRGKLNHSGLIQHTAQVIADILGEDIEGVKKLTYENAKKFYNL